jgi:hypothetical protein
MERRKMVAVIGNGRASREHEELAEAVGRELVQNGFRVLTGGLAGVMLGASRGARSAERYREGDVVGILPGDDPLAANEHVDIVISSGMGLARNVLVVQAADAVIAVGGASGTLSELALAWQIGKPIVALEVDGYSGQFAGQRIDHRQRPKIEAAKTGDEAVRALVRFFAQPNG